jgi:hypothetical protein
MSARRDLKNGLRHGLYAKRLSKDERDLITTQAVDSVEGEIALQRAMIARLSEVLENNGLGPGDQDALSEETRRTMKLLNESMSKLLQYVRVYSLQTKGLADPRREFEQGKHVARLSRDVFNYLEREEGD